MTSISTVPVSEKVKTMDKEETVVLEPPFASLSFSGKVKKVISLMSIEPALLLHMVASFLANVIITDFLFYQACVVDIGLDESFCANNRTARRHDAVADLVAEINIWRQVIDNAFPVLFVLFLGAWSDVYGRKLPILLAMLGYIIRYICLLLCVYFPSTSAQLVAVAASLPVSITGGRTAISMALYSYVADTTSLRDRTLRTGIMTAVRTFGKSAGSALGGVLKSQGKSYVYIFAVGGGLDIIAFAYTLYLIRNTRKENVDRSRKTCTIMKDIFNFKNITSSAKSFFKFREGSGRTKLILLVLILVCTMAPMQGEESVLQQFTYEDPIAWDTEDYAYYGTFRMLIAFIGGLISLGLLIQLLKVNDSILGVLSCISQIAGSLVYAFANNTAMMYIAPVVDILNGSMIISTRSMISKIVPRDEIGKVNSFVGTIDSTTPLYANPIYAAIFRWTRTTIPGLFFLVSVGITIPPLFIFSFFQWKWEKKFSVTHDDPDTKLVSSSSSSSSTENSIFEDRPGESEKY